MCLTYDLLTNHFIKRLTMPYVDGKGDSITVRCQCPTEFHEIDRIHYLAFFC